ncbi:MAG: glycosyltransferase family 10 domain-containing protein [bacterium]
MSLKTLIRRYRNLLASSDGHILYYNWWNKQPADEIWFTGFLQSRGYLERYPKANYVFFSSLGSINILRIDTLARPFSKQRKRIYFNGENNHHPNFKPYLYNLLDYRSIDLSLGFDYTNDPRYLRFPLWILEMFPPQSTVDDIKRICDTLSHQQWDASMRSRFCALVSGNRGPDDPGAIMRTNMVQCLKAIAPVDCAGKLLHNTDELKERFNDNKAEFLKQYKFYICPENASVEGYVTEKVFHAIGSGCIPIYWGAQGNPEPDVLNRNAILFWDPDGDNSALLKQIEILQSNDKLYREFFEQPRLKPDAWQVVAGYFERLENHLNELFQ